MMGAKGRVASSPSIGRTVPHTPEPPAKSEAGPIVPAKPQPVTVKSALKAIDAKKEREKQERIKRRAEENICNTTDQWLQEAEKYAATPKRRIHMQSPKTLEIQLDGSDHYIKKGSLIAYRGKVKSAPSLGGKIKMKRSMMGFAGTGILLKKMSGTGTIWLAEDDKDVHLLYLREGEKIYVNQESVLAFDQDMDWTIKMYGPSNVVGVVFTMFMFVVILKGPGVVAIMTDGEVLSLDTGPEPENHLTTEAAATVLWTGNLRPKAMIKNVAGKFVGQSSKLKLQFKGPEAGFVLLQPSRADPPSLITSLSNTGSGMLHLARSTNAELSSAAAAGVTKYKNALTSSLSRRAGSQAKLAMERGNSSPSPKRSRKKESPPPAIEDAVYDSDDDELIDFSMGPPTEEERIEFEQQYYEVVEGDQDLPPAY